MAVSDCALPPLAVLDLHFLLSAVLMSFYASAELMRCFEHWNHLQLAPASSRSSRTPISPAGLQAHRECCGGAAGTGSANQSLARYTWIRDPKNKKLPVGLRQSPKPRRPFTQENCWPKTPVWYQYFNPSTCCYRAYVDVSAMIVGFPKCATMTMLKLLGRHPEIAADEFENEALTETPWIGLEMVSAFNFALRQLMLTKPSSRLSLLKFPGMVYHAEQMQRIAQIPGLKVIVMLREPTRWLHSFYNFFAEDCARNRSLWTACCKKMGSRRDGLDCDMFKSSEIPWFWRDVVQRGESFSRFRMDVAFGHHSFYIQNYVLNFLNYEDVAFVDSGIFRAGHQEAISAIQALLKFLGVSAFDPTTLTQLLAEFRKTRGGHAVNKVRRVPWRARLCPNSRKWRNLGNSLYHAEREKLRNLLLTVERRGSLTLRSQELFKPPCPSS